MAQQLARRESDETSLAQSSPDQDAMAIATTRAAQEVQAAMVVAKRFPRDVVLAERRIMDCCKRKGLAEQAIYAYPRGGTTVEGPSIRLAEAMAQNWGNIDTGIIELAQEKGESTMMAYAWDLETNTRQVKVFQVRHERHTKHGMTLLTDPRDIYEMTANQGARRQRACILGVIPGDIVEAAVDACNKTMAGGNTEPLADRAKKMLATFEGMGVTKAMIEARLGHRLDTLNETEFVGFRKIYRAIQDNMQPVSAFFGADLPARGQVNVADVLGKATETATPAGGSAETAPQPAGALRKLISAGYQAKAETIVGRPDDVIETGEEIPASESSGAPSPEEQAAIHEQELRDAGVPVDEPPADLLPDSPPELPKRRTGRKT